jgi:hypothetical protein
MLLEEINKTRFKEMIQCRILLLQLTLISFKTKEKMILTLNR